MSVAIKSVKQGYQPNNIILNLLDTFRFMVNECIRIGLENNVSSMKRLSSFSYTQLDRYAIYGNYKICAIARAAGILAARKKSIKRGVVTKNPYAVKPTLTAYLGFKIVDNVIRIPLGNRKYFDIPLNDHTQKILQSVRGIVIHSFTLTANTVNISYSRQVKEIEVNGISGIDRNLRNLTYGNCERVIRYDLSQAIEIAETTKDIVKSFKRNDARIRKKLASKYGQRRRDRVNQILHSVSKDVVHQAKRHKEAIAFEDLTRIRQLYQRGNGQTRYQRRVMNSWSFSEIKRQIDYKARWEGIPVIQLSKSDTRSTSSRCPQCGERLQEDRREYRQLWCPECKRWQDRDVVAAMNLSLKGLLRFGSSKGIAGEARKGNSEKPIILRVDAMKLGHAMV